MAGTNKQMVFDWLKAKGTVTARDLYEAFPSWPKNSLRQALHHLEQEGWVKAHRQQTRYSVDPDTPRPPDLRGLRKT